MSSDHKSGEIFVEIEKLHLARAGLGIAYCALIKISKATTLDEAKQIAGEADDKALEVMRMTEEVMKN